MIKKPRTDIQVRDFAQGLALGVLGLEVSTIEGCHKPYLNIAVSEACNGWPHLASFPEIEDLISRYNAHQPIFRADGRWNRDDFYWTFRGMLKPQVTEERWDPRSRSDLKQAASGIYPSLSLEDWEQCAGDFLSQLGRFGCKFS